MGSQVTRVMGFHPANLGLHVPFRSWIRSRQVRDRQTDGRTDRWTQTFYNHFIVSSLYTEVVA